MKTRTVVCSVIALALTMFIGSAALAECPDGKTEVTIVKGKSGQIMTICVPDAAIPHIGGPGDVVIPATCPCFSQEEVQKAVADAENLCGSMHVGIGDDGELCRRIYVLADQDQFIVRRYLDGCRTSERYRLWGGILCLEPVIGPLSYCLGPNDDDYVPCQDDELRACEAILMSLEWVAVPQP